MNEVDETIIWVGEIKWKLHTFTVEAELELELEAGANYE